jgi:hypothetical protein
MLLTCSDGTDHHESVLLSDRPRVSRASVIPVCLFERSSKRFLWRIEAGFISNVSGKPISSHVSTFRWLGGFVLPWRRGLLPVFDKEGTRKCQLFVISSEFRMVVPSVRYLDTLGYELRILVLAGAPTRWSCVNSTYNTPVITRRLVQHAKPLGNLRPFIDPKNSSPER